MPTITDRQDHRTAVAAASGAGLRTTRRVRVPWLITGVLLIAGSALAFGVLAQGLADRRPVVVLARPLPRGTVINAADLAVAQVAADAGVALLPAVESRQLIGGMLLTSLPAGSPLTPELLGPAGLPAGGDMQTVGLALEPGEYPTSSLAPGDRVSVVRTTESGTVLTDDGVVLEVNPTATESTTLLVSIVVEPSAAAGVVAAAAADQARLVLHGVGR